jgi:hypothetical protein
MLLLHGGRPFNPLDRSMASKIASNHTQKKHTHTHNTPYTPYTHSTDTPAPSSSSSLVSLECCCV